ncbi:MAG: hypothetical protein NWP98_07915 [Erythrobacter sp.]|nr:hypothetical protein [Erythrobacter sp.]
MNHVMFENPNPVSASFRDLSGGLRSHDHAPVRRESRADARVESRGPRRAGEALRAMEWREITARLNAARDLRLLLRNEAQSPIEVAAASFGDAAASYFALLDDNELGVNPTSLGQSKVLGAMVEINEANRVGDAAEATSDDVEGDAREMK